MLPPQTSLPSNLPRKPAPLPDGAGPGGRLGRGALSVIRCSCLALGPEPWAGEGWGFLTGTRFLRGKGGKKNKEKEEEE